MIRNKVLRFEATESQADIDHIVVDLLSPSEFGGKPAEKLRVMFYFPRRPYKGFVEVWFSGFHPQLVVNNFQKRCFT